MKNYRVIVMSPSTSGNLSTRVFDDYIKGEYLYSEAGQTVIKDKLNEILFTGPSEYTIVIKQ